MSFVVAVWFSLLAVPSCTWDSEFAPLGLNSLFIKFFFACSKKKRFASSKF
jgi:hypothetical protein